MVSLKLDKNDYFLNHLLKISGFRAKNRHKIAMRAVSWFFLKLRENILKRDFWQKIRPINPATKVYLKIISSGRQWVSNFKNKTYKNLNLQNNGAHTMSSKVLWWISTIACVYFGIGKSDKSGQFFSSEPSWKPKTQTSDSRALPFGWVFGLQPGFR